MKLKKKKVKIKYFIKKNFQTFCLIKIIVIGIFLLIPNKPGNIIIKNNFILFENIKYQTNKANDNNITISKTENKNDIQINTVNNNHKDEQSYYHSPKERIEAFEKGKKFFKICMNKTLINIILLEE